MNDDMLFAIRLSLQVALLSSVLVAIIGTSLGYLFASKQFPFKLLCQIIVTLPLVLPPSVTGYYLVVLFGRSGLLGQWVYHASGWSVMFTWWAAVLASFVVSLPLMIKSAEVAIAGVDPVMKQSAYVLGYSERETFFRIVLPLAKPGLLSGLVLSFARGMGEFGATLMLAGNIPQKTSTMPLTIYSLSANGDWNQAHILAGILTLSSAAFLYVTTRLNRELVP